MMNSEDTTKVKEGGRLIIYGVIGIIIMVSANFLANTLTKNVID